MRRFKAIALLVAGVVVGAGVVTVGGTITAQKIPTPSEREEAMNARFDISGVTYAMVGRSRVEFRFLKDKQTGDCYLFQAPGDRFVAEMVKTDDNACSAF